jgi:hypothetical protein
VSDRFQQIVSDAEYALVILGDADSGTFSLVSPSPDALESLEFLGVVAIVQGRPRSAFAKDIPDQMIDAIAQEMSRRMEAAIVELERVLDMPAN